VAACGARAAGGDARSRSFLRFGYVMFYPLSGSRKVWD
jgi:hypothetical protein